MLTLFRSAWRSTCQLTASARAGDFTAGPEHELLQNIFLVFHAMVHVAIKLISYDVIPGKLLTQLVFTSKLPNGLSLWNETKNFLKIIKTKIRILRRSARHLCHRFVFVFQRLTRLNVFKNALIHCSRYLNIYGCVKKCKLLRETADSLVGHLYLKACKRRLITGPPDPPVYPRSTSPFRRNALLP